MKKSAKTLLSVILAALIAVCAAAPALAAEVDVAETGTVINVSDDDISRYGFLGAVQGALNQARDNATSDNPYTVNVPEGEYSLSYVIRMYSNTTLDLTGVTLNRVSGGNMLRVGSEDGVNTGAVGYAYENIRLIGGVFDGKNGENTIIKAFHTRNFTMENVTLLNEKEGHMTEFAGVNGLTVFNCAFKDQLLSPGNYGYEAIQLDVLHPFHITNGRSEDLPMTNVLIEGCYFENVPRAVGSHTAIHNYPHDNITIRNNYFKDMKSIAVQGMNWTNVDIRGNYIEDSPRGITIYSEPGGCTYLSSLLSKKGGTSGHVSDSYQTPKKANINIAYNTLVNIGSSTDAYASYVNHGIAVLGEKLTSKSPVDSSDESGGLPTGDYYNDGVNIHDNFVDIRGNGIRVEDARNVRIDSNEILCTKSTVQAGNNFYGIVFRDNVQASSIAYNTIVNAEVNGIQLVDSNISSINYNRIDTTGNDGITAYDSTIGSITDNDIYDVDRMGIFINGSSAKKVSWNRVRYCADDGIYFTSDSSSSDVSSNTVYGCDSDNGEIIYSRSAGKVKVGTNYASPASLTDFHMISNGVVGVTAGVNTCFKMVPDVRPTNTFATFSYSSSDESVVFIDAYGRAIGTGEGTATITVTSSNGVKKTYTVAIEGERDPVFVKSAPSKPSVKPDSNEVYLCLGASGGGAYTADIEDGYWGFGWIQYGVNMSVYSGRQVTVTADEEEGMRFKGWYNGVRSAESGFVESGGDILYSKDETYTFTLDEDTQLCAVFVPDSYILGDADDNGEIESVDATFVQRGAADIKTPYDSTLDFADVDGSGRLEITDATMIQYFLADMGNPYSIGKTI